MRIVLYQPEIFQNLAAVMRTCACIGLSLEVIYPLGFVMDTVSISSEFKRISMDYKCSVVSHNSWRSFLEKIQQNERIILVSPHSSLSTKTFDFNKNDILVFGRESSGVDNDVFLHAHGIVSIPMDKNYRSLNLSSAVSIMVGHLQNKHIL